VCECAGGLWVLMLVFPVYCFEVVGASKCVQSRQARRRDSKTLTGSVSKGALRPAAAAAVA
jgi:hypothetical protein